MKKIKFKVNCNIGNKTYQTGDEFKPSKNDMFLLCKLNEKGFIESLSNDELLEISNSFKTKKKKKEES